MLEGVAWREAAELSSAEHHQFKVTDSWESAVERWLDEKQLNGRSPAEEGQVRISDALSGAVNVPLQHQDRGKEMRMVKVLRHLGWERKRVPGPDGKRVWAYVKEEQ
jgi:predicted P-loop ATPase